MSSLLSLFRRTLSALRKRGRRRLLLEQLEERFTPAGIAPIAADDWYGVSEDDRLTVLGLGVLANDSDADGDNLTASLVNGPAHGSLYLDPSGAFIYTPEPNYAGDDAFTYRATDTESLSSTATVSLSVWGVDDPIELAAPGPQAVTEDSSLMFS